MLALTQIFQSKNSKVIVHYKVRIKGPEIDTIKFKIPTR